MHVVQDDVAVAFEQPGAYCSPKRMLSIGRAGSPTRFTGTRTVPGNHGTPTAAARWADGAVAGADQHRRIGPLGVLPGEPAGDRRQVHVPQAFRIQPSAAPIQV